jgi:predicted regulator of Ras-like GTPase activity (Roadblock/LC7/MglB family)
MTERVESVGRGPDTASRPARLLPSRAQQFTQILGELRRLPGIGGGLIVTPDGLVVTADLPAAVSPEALAALAATLGRELEVGAEHLARGQFQTAFFSAADGTVFVGGSPIGFVILLGDAAVDTTSISAALRAALTRLEGVWRI